MPTFEETFGGLLPLKIDDWGMVVAVDDRESGARAVVRRLNPKRRRDPMAVAALKAEAEFAAKIEDPRAGEPTLAKLDGDEYIMVYRHLAGTRLDWLIADLERHRLALSPAAAVNLLDGIFFVAEAVQRLRPPFAFGRQDWGHGELIPSNILVSDNHGARVINSTLCVSGVRTEEGNDQVFCAPELLDPTLATATTDVYALGALLAYSMLGRRAILHGARRTEPGADVARLFTALVESDDEA